MKPKDALCAGCGIEWSKVRPDKKTKVKEDGTYDIDSNQFVCDFCYIGLIQRGLDVGSPKQLIVRIKEVRKEFDRKQRAKQLDVIDTSRDKWDINNN
jgi:hypothetical protein